MNTLLQALTIALIITILTEYAVLLLLIRKNFLHLLLYTILMNGVTNPLLNYLYLFVYPSLVPLELGVIMVETLLIYVLVTISLKYAFLCSLCANCISIISGRILFGIIH